MIDRLSSGAQAVPHEVNGMEVVDRLLREHGLVSADEVWVHGMWTPGKWLRCLVAKMAGRRLVRMLHGSLSPIYLQQQGKRKKRLVKPIEKFLFKLADRIVVTGPWEIEWARAWGLKGPFEIIDLKQFFSFDLAGCAAKRDELLQHARGQDLHVLYLGREHPLKGVDALRLAVTELNRETAGRPNDLKIELREVFCHFGAQLEEDWAWADVLVLPTLSENFGLVVAEALARGKPVVTTDGAPAWEGQEGLAFIKGYRNGNRARRVAMLKDALAGLWRPRHGHGCCQVPSALFGKLC